MTFMQFEAAFADTFPEERRVGKSSVHRWWSRSRR